MLVLFPEKFEKFPEIKEIPILKKLYLFLQLYIARVGSGAGSMENFPDSAKKIRIPNTSFLPVILKYISKR